MKNNLSDLANHLFEQVERLLDDDVCTDTESTNKEIAKTNAMCNCAKQIQDIGRLQLDAIRAVNCYDMPGTKLPELLEIKR
jgi:hypothetical protein